MKALLNIVGSMALGLALLGVVLPLLPTTPFLLLASACYVRGSPRMYGLLLNAPLFGAYLSEYREKRTIPRRARLAAMVVLWLSLLWTIQRMQPVPLKLVLLAVGIGVSIFLWNAPSQKESASKIGNDLSNK